MADIENYAAFSGVDNCAANAAIGGHRIVRKWPEAMREDVAIAHSHEHVLECWRRKVDMDHHRNANLFSDLASDIERDGSGILRCVEADPDLDSRYRVPVCSRSFDRIGSYGSISFDVLSWLSEQKMSLIRIDWRGGIVCVGGASGYSANPFRVQWQLETRRNPALRIEYCRSIISKKIEASIVTLEKSIRRSEKWERQFPLLMRL